MRLSKIISANKEKYGLPVICREGKGYWRRDVFPQYKGNREEGRKSSGFDWKTIYNIGDDIANELRDVFKYPNLIKYKFEADDAIASVVRSFPEQHLIVSRDKDFLQLKYFGNVTQLDVIAKAIKELPEDKTLDEFFVEMIIKGQSKDGIPSIFSENDRIMNKIRQKPISKKMLEAAANVFDGKFDIEKMVHMIRNSKPFENLLKTTGITDDEIRANMYRNLEVSSLITPLEEYDDEIKDYLNSQIYEPDVNKILEYFTENNLTEVSGSINDFLIGDFEPEHEMTEQERWNALLG